MAQKNYLDEAGVRQLLEYLELQHNAINKRIDLLTPEYIQQIIKQSFDDFSLDNVIIYGGSAIDQTNNNGLVIYSGSASTGGRNE